jgi:hypothetical protein
LISSAQLPTIYGYSGGLVEHASGKKKGLFNYYSQDGRLRALQTQLGEDKQASGKANMALSPTSRKRRILTLKGTTGVAGGGLIHSFRTF